MRLFFCIGERIGKREIPKTTVARNEYKEEIEVAKDKNMGKEMKFNRKF